MPRHTPSTSLDAQHLSSVYGYNQHIAQQVLDTCQGSKSAAEIILAGSAALNIGPREAAQSVVFAANRKESETDPLLIHDPAMLPSVVSLAHRAAQMLQDGGPPNETNVEVCARSMRETGVALVLRLQRMLSPK